MKSYTKNLEPAGDLNGQWSRQNESIRVDTGSGAVVDYHGEALISTTTGQSIEFQLKTKVFRSAQIDIPVLVSSKTSVSLFINDQAVEQFTLPPEGSSTSVLQHIPRDVTEWTQAAQLSKLKLRFVQETSGDTIKFLLSNNYPELHPRVIQNFVGTYAFKVLAFFVLSALCLLGLAILIPVHLQFLTRAYRYYALVGGSFLWLVGTLGLLDMIRLPLVPTLRRLYKKSESEREAVLLSLFLTCLFVYLGVTVALLGIRARQKYSNLILIATEGATEDDDEAIKQAFISNPWRKEAQILFERRAFDLRKPHDMVPFRRHVKTFVTDQLVKQAAENAPSYQRLPYYLIKDARTLSDPVLWYASLLLEAETGDRQSLLKEALNFLALRNAPEARVQRLYTRMSLIFLQLGEARKGADQKRIDELTQQKEDVEGELHKLLTGYLSDKAVTYSFAFQNACDALAVSYLNRCNCHQALYWFEQELRTRATQASFNSERLWHRPPEKLYLYYVLCPTCTTYGSPQGPENAKNIRKNFDDLCKCRSTNLDATDKSESDLAQKLLSQFNGYNQQDNWLKGTVRDSKVTHELRNDLEMGWRY